MNFDFKVWDKEANKMGKVTVLRFTSKLSTCVLVEYSYINDEGEEVKAEAPYDSSCYSKIDLMQYTGIKDEYGTKVYEKDILRWTSNDTDGTLMESLSIVKYEGGCFFLVDEKGRKEETLKEGIKYNKDWEKVELIGSVYENMKLLEEKNEE